MKALIFASLALNIAVLVPVCAGLLSNAGWTDAAYGPDSHARSILLAVYLAILAASAGLLFKPVPAMVAGLLLVQILYKGATLFTVGSVGHPVVLSNLGIAAFHSLTLWFIWKDSAS